MADTVDYKKIQAIVEVAVEQKVEQMLEKKFGDKIEQIQNTIDATYKMVARDRQELLITQSKVDDHEIRITTLESNFASA